MNKILRIVGILLMMIVYTSSANAKLNIFPKPRYIPDLTFFDAAGKVKRLSDFKADLLMAVLWSRTCGPCIVEMKNLNNFANKMQDKGIRVILISPESDWKTADERRMFMQKIGAPDLVNYLDRKKNFSNGMGIMVTPTTILVNRNNEEVGQITGRVKWDDADVERYMLKIKKDALKQLDNQETADK